MDPQGGHKDESEDCSMSVEDDGDDGGYHGSGDVSRDNDAGLGMTGGEQGPMSLPSHLGKPRPPLRRSSSGGSILDTKTRYTVGVIGTGKMGIAIAGRFAFAAHQTGRGDAIGSVFVGSRDGWRGTAVAEALLNSCRTCGCLPKARGRGGDEANADSPALVRGGSHEDAISAADIIFIVTPTIDREDGSDPAAKFLRQHATKLAGKAVVTLGNPFFGGERHLPVDFDPSRYASSLEYHSDVLRSALEGTTLCRPPSIATAYKVIRCSSLQPSARWGVDGKRQSVEIAGEAAAKAVLQKIILATGWWPMDRGGVADACCLEPRGPLRQRPTRQHEQAASEAAAAAVRAAQAEARRAAVAAAASASPTALSRRSTDSSVMMMWDDEDQIDRDNECASSSTESFPRRSVSQALNWCK